MMPDPGPAPVSAFGSEATDRNRALTAGLPLDRPGIEFAPLFRPIVAKARANVLYVDVCSDEESRAKHAHYEHDPIVEVDVVWLPGRRLIDCVPRGQRFAWGIASHVLEHVPDPIGWLNQVLAVMEDGAVLSLALPDKDHCFDRFRHDTSTAELIESWIREQTIPSPRQIFDFTAGSVTSGYVGHDGDPLGKSRIEDCTRGYTDEQSLEYAMHTWRTGDYLDVHCSVFSVGTISAVLGRIVALGVLAVEVSEPIRAGSEFHVRLTKTGEPLVRHPGPPHPQSLGMARHHLIPNADTAPADTEARTVAGRLRPDLRRALGLGRHIARRIAGRR